jgi:ribose 1,5-bisphosphate isomerase
MHPIYGKSVDSVVDDIKTMKIRGARNIAIAGLEALKDVAEEAGFGKRFDSVSKKLISVRPTAVTLYNAVKKVKKEKTVDAIEEMIYYFENIGDVIGTVNYKLIKKYPTILTHCHSGSVIELLKIAKKKKIKFKVIVTETRPRLQGKTTARALVDVGIPVVYIIDDAAGFYIREVDAMIFGCDAIRKEGVVNKIGTYMLAVLAKENRVPVYFVGGLMKLDKRKKLIIEERDPDEITGKEDTKNFEIRNPAFDVTPWKYITGLVTEKGILKPAKVKRMLK